MEEQLPGFEPEEKKPDSKPNLRLVDTSTGELLEGDACPTCEYLEKQIAGMDTELRAWRTRHANLKRDKEQEMRGSNLWPLAVAVFRYWQERTGHEGAHFTPDRFELIAAHIKRDGPEACRQAIDGNLASDWHHKRGTAAKRNGPIHDDIGTIFGKQDSFERFRELAGARLPTIRGATMLETAQEVANRVLERAELIRRGDDPVAIGHLLIEINRILVEWEHVPNNSGEPAQNENRAHPRPQ